MVDWHTGFVVHELETEVEIQNTPMYRLTLATLLPLEHLIRKASLLRDCDSEALESWKRMRTQLRMDMRCMFNGYFGSVFRTATHPSLLAVEMMGHADFYTSSVENLLRVPLTHESSLLPLRVPMVHEPRTL